MAQIAQPGNDRPQYAEELESRISTIPPRLRGISGRYDGQWEARRVPRGVRGSRFASLPDLTFVFQIREVSRAIPRRISRTEGPSVLCGRKPRCRVRLSMSPMDSLICSLAPSLCSLGSSGSFSEHAVGRYVSHFGPLNQAVQITPKYRLIIVDAPSLVDEDEERAKHGVSIADWPSIGGPVEFVKKLPKPLGEADCDKRR